MELACLGPKTDRSAGSCRIRGLQFFTQQVRGVTLGVLRAFDCFCFEVCLEVQDRSANPPAGSLGNLEQPCHVRLNAVVAGEAWGGGEAEGVLQAERVRGWDLRQN